MTLWSMMRSPLMTGAERTMNDAFTLALLANVDVLAIGKESFCGHPLVTTQEESVWIAPGQDGRGVYAVLFNLTEETRTVGVDTALVNASGARLTEKEIDPVIWHNFPY